MALAKRVVAQTKKTSQEILNSAQLELKCLQKPTCVLFLRGQKLRPYERQWMDKLMHEHRTLQFAWVDSTISKLSIESMLPEFVPGEHRMVLFRRQRDPSGEKHKAVITAKAYRNVFDAMPVAMFLKENVGKELKALSKTPTISRRKSSKAKKSTSSTSEASSSKRTNGGQRSNTKRQAKVSKDNEEGDEYYFPQGVEEADVVDVDAAPYDADDGTEVLDLDAE
jgi:hypothetical protein